MELNDEESIFDSSLFTTLENILMEYTTQVYKKFKEYDKKKNIDTFKYIIIVNMKEEKINPYSLYSLFIMDLVDTELQKESFFDQESKLVPVKSEYKEGNEFMCNNEIYSVMNELTLYPEKFKTAKQIFSRVRTLSFLNVCNPNIDVESITFENIESPRFRSEMKTYLFGNPRHFYYGHLLKAALDKAKIFEHPEPIPRTMQEFQQFLKNPLLYVVLEPYNHI
jgi:hypothetical protein